MFAGNFSVIEVSNRRWRIAQAAEIRWWKRYLAKQSVDEYSDWKKGYWTSLLKKLQLSLKPNARVLDAGCGPAGIFTALEQCEVEAVDPLLKKYDSLDHFDRDQYPYVSWHAQPLETFKGKASFDYVFCLNVINHVRDLDVATEVLAKAAKPDGTLIISVDAHRHKWLKPIFRTIPGDVLHPHQLDLKDYEELFERHGMSVVDKVLYRKEFLFDYWVFPLQLKSENPSAHG